MTRQQQGVPTIITPRASRVQSASRHQVGTSHGIHPEDRPRLTDEHRPSRLPVYDDDVNEDAIYTTRKPTSVRRYAATPATKPPQRTIMRVTTHQGPPPRQRASIQTAAYQQPEPTQAGTRRLHWMVYVGIAMMCMIVGWIILTTLLQWWQVQQDNMRYGMPRTFQIDKDVKHGGVSHFTVENLNGHILIYEVRLTDVSKPHLYTGPVFSGAGTELQPATISFEDVNGDGYLDIVIAVGTGRYFLINDHSAFRPVNTSDHISGQGV